MLLIFCLEGAAMVFVALGIWKEAELIRFEDAAAKRIKRFFKREVK